MEMARRHSLQPLLHGDPLKTGDVDRSTSDVDAEALAARIGHSFTRAELAVEALTHRGTLDRRADLKDAFPHGNERLEFLGDRVLSLALADLLLKRFAADSEGQLARRHADLVSARTLGAIADEIDLATLRVTYAGAPAPTPAVLADMLEALLGAVFRDQGFAAAAGVVERLWDSRLVIDQAAPRPPKTQLQEWAQGRGLALPDYREIGREGAQHEPVFLIEVKVDTLGSAQGRGATKREAESAAAAALMEQLARS
jgi:ribonuclease-3